MDQVRLPGAYAVFHAVELVALTRANRAWIIMPFRQVTWNKTLKIYCMLIPLLCDVRKSGHWSQSPW